MSHSTKLAHMKNGRKFSIPFTELYYRAKRLSSCIERDRYYFTTWVSPEHLATELQFRTEAFQQLQPDMYWLGQQMLATEEKNQARKALTDLLQEFQFRTKIALGKNSTPFQLFRFRYRPKLSDKEIVSDGKHISITAVKCLDHLVEQRIDQHLLDHLNLAIQSLEIAIDNQQRAKAQREQKREERIEQGNALYKMIVEICEVGKQIWRNRNEAFYKDYLLYGSNKKLKMDSVYLEEKS